MAELTRGQMELHQRVAALQRENQALRAAGARGGGGDAAPAPLSLQMEPKKLDDAFSDLEAGVRGSEVRQRAVFVPLVTAVRSAPWPVRAKPVETAAGALDSVFVYGASRPRLRSAVVVLVPLLALWVLLSSAMATKRVL